MKNNISNVREKINLPYLEYDIISYCNLNCMGCIHFCNIDSEKRIIDVETYKADIKRLKEFVNEIDTLRIMGGEPLLNPYLSEIIEITHQYYPKTKMILVTNGIDLEKQTKYLFKVLKKYKVIVNISLYNETKNMIKKKEAILKQNEVKYFVETRLNRFQKYILEKRTNKKEKTFFHCKMKECHNLSNGYLNTCPLANYIDRFNKRFDRKYPKTSIFIHDPNMTVQSIKNLFDYPNEMCNYCSRYYVDFRRQIKNYRDAKMSDYIITEEEFNKAKKTHIFKNNIFNRSINFIRRKIEKMLL